MALIVLDASVVIAHFDPSDSHHKAAVTALKTHAADELVLPASAYAEALVDPSRRNQLPQVRRAVQALMIRIEPVGERIAERAAALRARYRLLRLPDALILAAGEELGADAVLTADRTWRRLNKRVTVIQ